MLPVAITPWCGNGEDALVDGLHSPCACAFSRGLLTPNSLGFRRMLTRGHFRSRKLQELAFKGTLHKLGIACHEAVLGRERLPRPTRRKISRQEVRNLD